MFHKSRRRNSELHTGRCRLSAERSAKALQLNLPNKSHQLQRHALPAVDRLPPGNRQQPGLERRLGPESLELLEGGNERFLGRIFRLRLEEATRGYYTRLLRLAALALGALTVAVVVMSF